MTRAEADVVERLALAAGYQPEQIEVWTYGELGGWTVGLRHGNGRYERLYSMRCWQRRELALRLGMGPRP